MWKLPVGILWSVLCAAFGLLPEGVMYFTWNLVNPSDPLTKTALVAIFYLGGAGFCFIFGFLAFALWVAGTQAIVESPRLY